MLAGTKLMMIKISSDGRIEPPHHPLSFIQREGRTRWYLCSDCRDLVSAVDDAESTHECGQRQ